MAISVNTNMMAQTAARNLGASYEALGTSTRRLSSGLRITSAKDDAAGLAVRELIRADVAALNQGVRNANDAVSMLQAAEGALGKIDENLVRMRQLAEQANTDTYSSTQKGIMQNEFNELADEITRIAEGTDFNDINLLSNTETRNISLGSGAAAGKMISITGQDMTASALGLKGTQETYTGPAVGNKTDAYLKGAAAGDTISFAVDGQTLTVDVGTSTLTLEQTAAKINEQSRAAVSGWEAASVAYDSNTGQYALKITAKNDGNVADMVVNSDADGDGTNNVTFAAGVTGVATDNVAATAFLKVDGSGSNLDIKTAGAVTTIENAIKTKDSFRAELGYKMNRLEAAASVLQVQSENLTAAESRISDVDVATEMTKMNRNQILAQAGISMLAQANNMPKMAQKLLG